MVDPKAGPKLAKDSPVRLEGRLLTWHCDGPTYKAETSRAIAIVYPYRRGYHWEIFSDGEVKYFGQVRSLHSALCHVEGNFVGRELLEAEAAEAEADTDEPARGEESGLVVVL